MESLLRPAPGPVQEQQYLVSVHVLPPSLLSLSPLERAQQNSVDSFLPYVVLCVGSPKEDIPTASEYNLIWT